MNTPVTIFLIISGSAAGLWLVLFVLQLSDLAASLLDVRGAHDLGKPGRPARRRYSEYVWMIPLAVLTGILVLVGAGFAITVAASAYGAEPAAVLGLTALVIGLVAVILLVGIAIVVALTRGEKYSYGQLRANLSGDSGQRLTTAQVSLFRSQLEEIDGRRRRIHLGFRDRARMAWLRAELDDLAAAFRVVPPTGLQAVSSVRVRTAHTYLWKGNGIRLVPVAFAALAFLSAAIAWVIAAGNGFYDLDADLGPAVYSTAEPAVMPLEGFANFAPQVLVTLLPIVVSYLVAIASARFALAAKVVWHAVNQKQRADAVDLIEEFERSSRKGVTGLGDRVARALQILRDQQAGG